MAEAQIHRGKDALARTADPRRKRMLDDPRRPDRRELHIEELASIRVFCFYDIHDGRSARLPDLQITK